MRRWLRTNWPQTTYAAGILVVLAALFVWVVPVRADAPSIAVHFIAAREGFRSAPYRDQAGNWTIGYGHKLSTPNPETTGPITEQQAEDFLRQRVETLIKDIDFRLQGKLADEQLAALASLAYNIGQTALADSRLLVMINNGAPIGEIIREWISLGPYPHRRQAAGERAGLSRRRAAEVGLYFFGTSDLR